MVWSFPLSEFVEKGNGIYAFASANLCIAPANPGECFSTLELILLLLPSGASTMTSERLP